MITLDRSSLVKVYSVVATLFISFVVSLFTEGSISSIALNITLITLFAFLLLRQCYKLDNSILTILLCYMYLYNTPLWSYVLHRSQISVYLDFQSNLFISKVSCLLLLFWSILYLFLDVKNLNNIKILTPRNNNFYIYCVFYLISLFSIIYGKTGETILESTYGQGQTDKSSLYEYALIPMIVCIQYSYKNKLAEGLLFVLFSFYIVKSLLYGGRIEVVMLGLLIYLCYFLTSMSVKKTLLLLLTTYVIMSFLGYLRSHGLDSISLSDFVQTKLFRTSDVITSQEGDVYYATMRIVGIVDEGYITFKERLLSFFSFIFSSVIPNSSFEVANLSSYKRDLFTTGGGALFIAYFYAYAGYAGTIIISYIIARLLSLHNLIHRNSFYRYYTLLFILTIPRWYAYGAVILMKFCILGSVTLFIVEKIQSKISK